MGYSGGGAGEQVGPCPQRAPTANVLSEGLDPGIHFDELDGAEDLVHLLHSSVGNSHAPPPEVGCHSGAEHLNIRRQPAANHQFLTGSSTEVWNRSQSLRDTCHDGSRFHHHDMGSEGNAIR